MTILNVVKSAALNAACAGTLGTAVGGPPTGVLLACAVSIGTLGAYAGNQLYELAHDHGLVDTHWRKLSKEEIERMVAEDFEDA